jgi:MFS family permease
MQPTATTPARPAISAHGLAAILGATAIALLATPLASPAMPEIARVFAERAQTEPFAQALLGHIQFLGAPSVSFLVKFVLLSVPALFIILGAPLTGWISDHWGRKSLLTVSLVVFAVAGMSGYFAETFSFLFAGRAVLGLAIAGIKTATVAMVGDYYEGARRQKVIGWQGSATKFGGVVFLLLGGFLANLDWRVPFLGYALAFLVLPSALLALKESLPAHEDHAGAYESSAEPSAPLLPCAFVFVSATLASGLFFITLVQLPFFLTRAFDASPLQTGLAVAVGNTVGSLISLSYHVFKRRMNYVAIYAVIFLFMAAGYYVLTVMPNYETSLLAMIVGGVGFGLYIPNHSSWILAIVGPLRRGFGVGLVTTAMFLGQFMAPILAEPLIDPADPRAVWRSISAILVVLGVLYVLLSRLGGLPLGERQLAARSLGGS